MVEILWRVKPHVSHQVIDPLLNVPNHPQGRAHRKGWVVRKLEVWLDRMVRLRWRKRRKERVLAKPGRFLFAEKIAMKTTFSERTIPLVGIAIDAAKVLRAGKKRYASKSNSLSAAVNKYLKENKLLEQKKQSLYSLRHAFKDRLTAASAPDIIDAELMGHKYGRPEYGSGPTLELKLDWLKKIALTVIPKEGEEAEMDR